VLYVSYDNRDSWQALGNVSGSDGDNGENGITPLFKVEEGVLYVSYDNRDSWQALGNVSGSDGDNGENGITPLFKVEEGVLYVSYDNRDSWQALGNVSGSDGDNGIDGEDGTIITIGENGNWFIDGVDSGIFAGFVNPQGLDFYPLPDGTWAVAAGKAKYQSEIAILSEYGGKPVTAIAADGFANCPNLTKITIPNSITSIGDGAFADCASPIKVTYTGSQTQWWQIRLGANNDALSKALFTYQTQGRLDAGTMIFHEDFEGYSTTTTNTDTFTALKNGNGGVWTLDSTGSPYYESAYTTNTNNKYTIENGQLNIVGKGASNDAYLVIADETTLWELQNTQYTIQYDIEYSDYAYNAKRYIALMWEYCGSHYSSFFVRVNGSGNYQMRRGANAWLEMESYDVNDLYAGSVDKTDTEDGTSIINKLYGIDMGGVEDTNRMLNTSLTVRIQIDTDGSAAIFVRANSETCQGSNRLSDDFVQVSRFKANATNSAYLNASNAFLGGALCLKVGGPINGYMDNIMVYTGHGDVPTNTTVSYEAPTPYLTQETVEARNYYTGYDEYNAAADATLLVPGLKQGFVPQGMDVWEEENLLLIAGYFKSNRAIPSSMLVAVDMTTGKLVKQFYLKYYNGSYYKGHAGGIAVTEKNLFLANHDNSGDFLYRIPLSAIANAEEIDTLTLESKRIGVPVNASFCNYSDGVLWVGDFYDPSNGYNISHTTVGVEGREGWAVGYVLADTEQEFGNEDVWNQTAKAPATPDYVIAIAGQVQGFTIVGDYIALSRSYGRTNDSHIELYENVLDTSATQTVMINGTAVPTWVLGDPAHTYTALPMSEGITAYDGKLLVLYESGASYYKDNGGKNPTDHVWELTLSAAQ